MSTHNISFRGEIRKIYFPDTHSYLDLCSPDSSKLIPWRNSKAKANFGKILVRGKHTVNHKAQFTNKRQYFWYLNNIV